MSDVDHAKALPVQAILESHSAKSSNESDDESDEEDYSDDDSWSCANGYLENAIYQALFPDVALAAYLISKMYDMVRLGSLKKVSKKVSSWRERVIACAATTVSAPASTMNTEKAVPAKGPTSDLRVIGPSEKISVNPLAVISMKRKVMLMVTAIVMRTDAKDSRKATLVVGW
jgi:hypothetical protein